MDLLKQKDDLAQNGFVQIPKFFNETVLAKLQAELNSALQKYAAIHKSFGYTNPSQGGAHHVLIEGGIFLDVLEQFAGMSLLGEALQGKFTINSFGGFNNSKDTHLYVCNVHRDIRFFSPGRPLMLNLLIMLDDFSLENGATHVLGGSHKSDAKPDGQMFFSSSTRITGDAGDMIVFDSRLWHAAGKNMSERPRRAITVTITNPFFKQQFNYWSAFSDTQLKNLSEAQKQLLGYFSRTPSTLSEWYAPPESRMYRADQDISIMK